jgi:hypothetical protein
VHKKNKKNNFFRMNCCFIKKNMYLCSELLKKIRQMKASITNVSESSFFNDQDLAVCGYFLEREREREREREAEADIYKCTYTREI